MFIERHSKQLSLAPFKKQKDYALKIQKIDKYMGYMAWAEIYLNAGKNELGL